MGSLIDCSPCLVVLRRRQSTLPSLVLTTLLKLSQLVSKLLLSQMAFPLIREGINTLLKQDWQASSDILPWGSENKDSFNFFLPLKLLTVVFFSTKWELRKIYNKIDTRQRNVVLLVLFWGFSKLWSYFMGPVQPSFLDSISFTKDDFGLLLLKWFIINLKFPSSQKLSQWRIFPKHTFPVLITCEYIMSCGKRDCRGS